MMLSRLLLALVLPCLSGCAAERSLLGLVPDQQSAIKTRTKTPTTSKLPRTRPTIQVSASEPILPQWTVPSPKPSRVLRYTLSPADLFKQVSPAIYTVAVLGKSTQEVMSQGSAVAVSLREAITNCHVVARGNTIVLANAATTLRAEVISADHKTDRCYLRVQDGELVPVPSIRDYDTLAVGEVVFTIGSPKGLVNTLGHGLVSGLRRSEDDAEYIPVSYTHLTLPTTSRV